MLERTAGCLESGSLRRLLPSSKKSLKSRRTLHSSFWHHGAGDLELSPIWAALVRATEPANQHSEVSRRSSTSQSAMLLDFLYPAGTINFLRQYSGWGVDRQDGRWGRSGLGKLGYRQYTSSAKDTVSTDQTRMEEGTQDQNPDTEDGNLKLLYERMGLTKSYDYEEAWRQYMLLDGVDQQLLRTPLMQYLTKSDRVVDAERITELFEMVREQYRSPIVYQATIRAHLKLRNLADAMQLHKIAYDTLESPAGSAELLAHFMQNSSWWRAFSLWTEFQERRREGQFGRYDLFELVVAMPNLADQTIELAEYVSRRIRNAPPSSKEADSKLKEFASTLIRRTLKTLDAFSPSSFSTLLEFLRLWEVDDSFVYEEAIETLLALKQNKMVVKCYRLARQGRGAHLSVQTLHKVLHVLCNHHSILGMQQILDDFFKFHSRPTSWAYKLCMKEFASQGDAKTVHALFKQFINSREEQKAVRLARRSVDSPLNSADEISPLLQVHAKRGEVAKAVAIFNQIENVYKLQPTLLCWNILLNAYGKVHDTSSAYEYFERLLESPQIRPDDYTFGTMMGICASRGDLERTIELYMLADELGIQKSEAMIDSLVSAYISEGDLQQAERLCEDAVRMELKGSGTRTRMWNYLLVAYAARRDLNNVNRTLQRMAEANVDYDAYTYSALMQALCMVNQPDKAYDILREVMVEAGVQATAFHYAVIMGGFLATGESRKVFAVQNRMMRRNVRGTTSSNLLTLKAQIAEDLALLDEGPEKEILERSKQMFQEVVATIDPQDVSSGPRKGHGRLAIDVAHTSTFYSYVMFVFGQREEFESVNKLYDEFKRTVPESKRNRPPVPVLSALMSAKLQERNFEAVEECWNLILDQAMEDGRTRPLPTKILGNALPEPDEPQSPVDDVLESEAEKVMPAYRLHLADSLVIYLRSLVLQNKIQQMTDTVKDVLDRGFVLDVHTWNKYVQFLARKHEYDLAFRICEEKLMPGWTGWAKIRWQLPVRNRLPIELRRARQWPTHLRPMYYTMLYLAREYIELQDSAAESPAYKYILSDLERDYPKTMKAIKTMPRMDNEGERNILRGRT
ncbi:TPR-like protein [Hyaloscypha variabilis F]|uniref:TPR-like protein n=1 Tax=Hyaloscypha variabilis (strain UAMH 11265 / GT02V1 / F) TaxID=1149755 RepID=A0A2J6S9C2_HYAVF|nr:TPR-like protein [Hyaloscypha variabilis F]